MQMTSLPEMGMGSTALLSAPTHSPAQVPTRGQASEKGLQVSKGLGRLASFQQEPVCLLFSVRP